MKTNRVALFLADESNEYQQMSKADALAVASRVGVELEVYFAADNLMQQIRQIYNCLHRQPEARPQAVLVMAVRVNAMDRVARDAAQAGVGWVSLHRRMESLARLRQEFPHLPFSFVTPDQREIGRIQGRQFRALLPQGGRLLYVQGEATSSPAQDRLSGMREAIDGARLEVASVLDGNWTTDDAARVVGNWLRIVMAGKGQLDLIGCQNDAMAMGARNALQATGDHLRRPEVMNIPVTGCDGVRTFGQRLVTQGQLAATIVTPSTGGPAVEMLARALQQGTPPAPELMLQPASFPATETLAQRAR